jgi:uncharacterized membrane protein (UPF0127 family)
MMARSAVYALPTLLVLAATALAAPAELPLKLPSGRTLTAELMLRPEDRAMGLMFRQSLPEERALLFAFDGLDFHAIWMKNCRFPIDIVWLDEEQRVVHVAAAVPPCAKEPCAVYQPLQRALYVVEMNAHQARREKIELGARLEFSLPR